MLENKSPFDIIIGMDISDLRIKLSKSIEFLKSELNQIRTGRISPQLISDVSVEAYNGTVMTLKEVGSITVMDLHNLAVTPWDKGVMDAIINGIRNSNLGLGAVKEADRVRVTVPALTEERRVQFTKEVSEKVEESKNSMRNIRQDAMKDIDKLFSDKLIGEDEKFKQKEEVEKIVREFVGQADTLGEEKKKEIMTI
ncbi:ribosome recycling factor [candidate division WWE3 bacterium]|uniref:Ribosome recycling factor n=1 Tax=candidate division WWE3 bacterium TaxID=2053526 RepID=A0A7X9E7L5_UNCKA|nr:ribosome recycling factor [candidate division WWE3 bacterium]